jgi:NAD(P)H dehydrogenase (quinone)
MKVLVMLVHPSRDSFCGQLADNIIAGLQEAGHETRMGDLYREGFQPALIEEDYAQFDDKPMPEDVLREQARIEWAEGLIFVMPIWWYQFPAMFKGWIDRVFSEHWAYEYATAFDREKTRLGWRKTLIVASAGGNPRTFMKYGYDQGLQALWDTGIWGYCGFRDIRTQFFYQIKPKSMTDEERAQHMLEARRLGREFASPPAAQVA